MEVISEYAVRFSGFALPVLALWLLVRCVQSMLREKYEPEMWAYFDTGSERAIIKHWEGIIGRAKSCDIVINRASVSKTQAALLRSSSGGWIIYDLDPSTGMTVQDQPDSGDGLQLHDGDTLKIADVSMVFKSLSSGQQEAVSKERKAPGAFVNPGISMFILTAFQALLVLQFSAVLPREDALFTALAFLALIIIEWCYYLVMRAINRSGFEPELIAFFLSTLGLCVVATTGTDGLLKQLLILLAAMAVFIFLGFWLRDLGRAKATRWVFGALALALLAVNLLIGIETHGARNWISVGPFTLQPSEFVKVLYIYAGAASLDRLFRGRNLFMFIGFSAACVGALALMGDFGTALIFFSTFLVISFMRSGNLATVILAVSAAALAGFLVLTAKPYAMARFATWGSIWLDPYGAGFQQTRALSAAASGGFFGVGAGGGWLHEIFAAETDMVFCLIAEELGLIIAICAVLCVVVLALFTVKNAAAGRSSFYVIAACAATSMMMIQLSLNVFGSVDLIPFTGVTFPFVSVGGSSFICCWGLLAFIKASDTRQDASFSVKSGAKMAKKKGGGK